MIIEHFAKLGPEHRAAVVRHLTSLDAKSRILRFGAPASDDVLGRYVAGIDFEKDLIEGVWDGECLAGVAHLAVYTAEDGCSVGELGISIADDERHRHLGQRLLSRVLLHARLLRLDRVYVQFASRNRPMGRLAREFTSDVEVRRGDACATIDMDPARCSSA